MIFHLPKLGQVVNILQHEKAFLNLAVCGNFDE